MITAEQWLEKQILLTKDFDKLPQTEGHTHEKEFIVAFYRKIQDDARESAFAETKAEIKRIRGATSPVAHPWHTE